MAAPFVTSTALLLKGAFPKLDRNEIRRCILESATPIILDSTATPHLISDPEKLSKYTPDQIAFSRRFFGRGLLNVQAAFEYAINALSKKELLSSF